MRINPRLLQQVEKLRKTNREQAEALLSTLIPTGAGTIRAERREDLRADRLDDLYAETPVHPPTRQRQRALNKPWRTQPGL